jgi:hypothetical protein
MELARQLNQFIIDKSLLKPFCKLTFSSISTCKIKCWLNETQHVHVTGFEYWKSSLCVMEYYFPCGKIMACLGLIE